MLQERVSITIVSELVVPLIKMSTHHNCIAMNMFHKWIQEQYMKQIKNIYSVNLRAENLEDYIHFKHLLIQQTTIVLNEADLKGVADNEYSNKQSS